MHTQQTTILTFPDLQHLWAFAKTLRVHYLEINTHTNNLICDCSTDDIIRAVTEFKAAVYEKHMDERSAQMQDM